MIFISPRPKFIIHRLTMHITILGAGAIGTAVKQNIKTDHTVELWDKVKDKIPEQKNLNDVIPLSDIVFFCFPTPGIQEGAEIIAPLLKRDALVVTLAKGLSPDGRLATDILEQALGPDYSVLLAGPMLAREFQDGKGAAALIASKNSRALPILRNAFVQVSIILSYTNDVRSAALASVWKNVYTLAVGITEGAGFGNNIQGLLAARCIAEAAAVANLLSIDAHIMNGVAGTADFLATAFSPQSRNRQAGIEIGKGLTPNPTEGARSIEPFTHILPTVDELPILRVLNSIVLEHADPRQTLEQLFFTGTFQHSQEY